ncbi:MAG TPA: hypothetical protein VE978_07190 [Chitinophagales bacterium]|nr:hypothetical protein [Chitinophagales bacterium]
MNWEITTKRFIAFFDIMGFKEMVFRLKHEEVFKKLRDLSFIIDTIKKYDRSLSNTNKIEVANYATIKSVMFSDSVLFISEGATREDAKTTIVAAVWILNLCLRSEIPIKGAIAYGDFTAELEYSIYFGQPLIDAFLLQDELLFYGAIIHHSLESFLILNNINFDNLLSEYMTPLKSGKVKHKIVNWANPKLDLGYSLSPTNGVKNLYCSVSGKPRIYVDNTLDYINSLQIE